MKLTWAYLKQCRQGILFLLLAGAIFFASFWLYHLPLRAVLYPTMLCLLLGAAFLVAGFLRVRKKHKHLRQIQSLSAAMMEVLPEAESVEEADYQAILAALRAEVAALESTSASRYREMVDYYTVWVHQIKTPIASMRLTLQNEDTPLQRKLSSDLFRIEQYVEMVLAYLRLDAEAGDYVFHEQSLDAVVRQSVAKFASEFIDRKIRLVLEPLEGTLVTDAKWLSFVIEQLLSNALKYTREGSIRIYPEDPKTLCIADTGIGISPADLPRVFEKGYTGLNGRIDRQASGLGLYLCKRVCQNLGVGISISSVPDRGTTVRLDLEQYDLQRE